MVGKIVDFDSQFFEEILRSAQVEALTRASAEKALAYAQTHAPVDTGDYKRGLHIREENHAYRKTYLVVGEDWKTFLVESKTGNLLKALKHAKIG